MLKCVKCYTFIHYTYVYTVSSNTVYYFFQMALKLFLLEKENMLLKFRLSTVSEELEIIKRTLVFYNTNQVIWTNNVIPPFQK